MTPQALYDVCEHTWPPARRWQQGTATLRDGQGGGKRVSAATCDGVPGGPELSALEQAMADLGQPALFMIRDGDTALDAHLDAHGYRIVDPVTLYHAPIARLTDIPIPPVTCFAVWPPLAIMAEIWAAGGIGPDRLAVMARAKQGTGLLARQNDKPAGAAFAGLHGQTCMVHAVEVLPHQRRKGVAQWIMRRAAFWAKDHGATSISVLCTKANRAANALYQGMGFDPVGSYHYRIREDT